MSYLIAELFERHDRVALRSPRLLLQPRGRQRHPPARHRGVRSFHHHQDLSDEAAARAIRADEIDILIDLNGLTTGARMAILRWRPAPIQATYLGFIGPVPMPELDYLFCDESSSRRRSRHAYRPRPLYIAPNYQANDSKRVIGRRCPRGRGLPEDRFVFCCFSNHYKITEAMFGAWMEILRRVEWLHPVAGRDNIWSRDNLRARAAEPASIRTGCCSAAGSRRRSTWRGWRCPICSWTRPLTMRARSPATPSAWGCRW